MNVIDPVDEQSAGLCRALEPVLATSPVRDPAAAARLGSDAILPAVIALRALQRSPRARGRHCLLHRRCRILPADGANGAAGPEGATGLPAVDVTERAGWQLVRARAVVGPSRSGGRWPDGAVVVHELARRLDDAPADAAPPRAPARSRSAGRAPDRDTGARPPGAGRAVRIDALDVAEWAEAGGDRNRVHTVPGAAREAGLRVGADDVVAHGLLLAAVSLALVPAEENAVEARMPAPLPVPAAGAAPTREPDAPPSACVLVDGRTGELTAGGRCVLRRR